jgi:flavoprotein hydroxylase
VIHPDAPNAGHLFVQGEVGGLLFDDVHGAGWRLVSIGDRAGAELDEATAAWFASIGGDVVHVDASEASYGRWAAEHGASWVLQRPDFHLYGSATSPAGAAGLVRDLRRQLAGHLEGAPT